MKLKMVIVDLEMSPRAKKWALRASILGALLVGGVAVATAPALVTWTNGQTLQATDLNNSFQYVLDQIPIETRYNSDFRAQVSVNQNVVANGSIVYDSVGFDALGEYSNSTGVFTASRAGTYIFTCEMFINSAPANDLVTYTVGLALGGYPAGQYFASNQTTNDIGVAMVSTSGIIVLGAGTTVNCVAAALDTTNLSTSINLATATTAHAEMNNFTGARIN